MGRKPSRGTGAEVTSYRASCPPQASACPRGTAARRVQPCHQAAPGRGIPWFPPAARAPLPAVSLLPAPTGDGGRGPRAMPWQGEGLDRLHGHAKGPLGPHLCPHHKPDLPPLVPQSPSICSKRWPHHVPREGSRARPLPTPCARQLWGSPVPPVYAGSNVQCHCTDTWADATSCTLQVPGAAPASTG